MEVLRALEVVGTAVLIFGIVNYGFLAGKPLDRMRLPGVRVGDPAARPPAVIVARIARRGRVAIWWSAAAVSVTAAVLIGGRLPSFDAVGLLLGAATLFGRSAAQAVIGAGEALAARTPGPRVSRGRTTTLADYAAPWSWGLALATTVAYLVVAVPRLWAVEARPTLWVAACLASGVLYVGALALAAWASAQPQAASSDIELRWDDHLRADALNDLGAFGPFAVGGFGGIAGLSAGLGGDPLWKWGLVVMTAAGMVVISAGPRRYARRLWTTDASQGVGRGRG